MEVLQKEILDAGAEEGLDRFLRRVDDGLAFHVEAGVQHHLAAGGFAHGLKQRVKIGIVVFETVCSRAEPLTWVMAGNRARDSGRTLTMLIM